MDWWHMLLSKWPDFMGVLLGAFLGSWLSDCLARRRSRREREATCRNLLRFYQEELQRNQETLRRLKSYIDTGPSISNLWGPAVTLASLIETDAWDDFVREGGLFTVSVSEKDQCLLRLTARKVRDSRRAVVEFSANWPRIMEWAEHDRENGSPQRASTKVFLQVAIRETRGRIDSASEGIEEALKRLRVLLDSRRCMVPTRWSTKLFARGQRSGLP